MTQQWHPKSLPYGSVTWLLRWRGQANLHSRAQPDSLRDWNSPFSTAPMSPSTKPMPTHACERLKYLQLGKSPQSPPHTLPHCFGMGNCQSAAQTSSMNWKGSRACPSFPFFSCLKNANVNSFSFLWTFCRFLRRLKSLLSILWWETSFLRTWTPPLNIKEPAPIPQSLERKGAYLSWTPFIHTQCLLYSRKEKELKFPLLWIKTIG